MAKFEMVSNGECSMCVIDGIGYGTGVESVRVSVRNLQNCEVEIKIGSILGFRHHTPREIQEMTSRILSSKEGNI